ncbi:MAG: nucleotidyltransferase domain-containing protein [Aigarchaeota archaeon]|nr:nucleotidyltransferase domain-containing protein [Candidatus Pelearchaeum maunauluense]
MFVEEARRRQSFFNNLKQHLEELKRAIHSIDPEAELYIFGSVARGDYTLASDVDILIVTRMQPGFILKELWLKGFREPFEFHVVSPDMLEHYKTGGELVKV